ncbi:MAG: DUF6152 family protein [Gammaproteobacteria bacterium]
MTIRGAVALAVAGLSLANAAIAHHGFGNFDTQREVTLEGTITGIDFVNPHAYVYFDAVDAAGAKTPHRCEMRAATVLRRSGWSADMFKTGEPIKITGAPDRFDTKSCYVNTVVFADGTTADRYAQLTKPAAPGAQARAPRAPRLPSGEPNLNGDWAPEQLVMTDPRGRAGALVPVSKAGEFKPGDGPTPGAPPPGQNGRPPGAAGAAPGGNRPPPFGPRVAFTEAGKKAADAFHNFSPENPRMRCETTSILFDWTFDGPVNRITQNADTITLQYGQLGFMRTIHMDTKEHPANVERTRAGHSIGRWDNDVLVVDTVGFAPGVLNPPIMNSEQLHVVERFTFDPDKMAITRSYSAEDPVNFTDQFTGSDTIGVADLPYAPDTCKELTSFVDPAKQSATQGGSGAPPPSSANAPAAAAPAKSWWKFWEWFN